MVHSLSILIFVGFIVTFSVSQIVRENSVATPGRTVLWELATNSEDVVVNAQSIADKIQYTSRSTHPADVAEYLSQHISDYQVVALFATDSVADMVSTGAVAESVRSSPSAHVFSNIYHPNTKMVRRSISDSILDLPAMTSTQTVSLKEFKDIISKSATPTTAATYKVVVAADDSLDGLFAATAHSSPRILFVAVQEPTLNGIAPATVAHYKRILGSSSSQSAYRPPSGAEFSIYYGDTNYLYITPDIFTGLMTFLFMFFVVLIGLSCMGSIQGMSTFYDKVPVVGKEA